MEQRKAALEDEEKGRQQLKGGLNSISNILGSLERISGEVAGPEPGFQDLGRRMDRLESLLTQLVKTSAPSPLPVAASQIPKPPASPDLVGVQAIPPKPAPPGSRELRPRTCQSCLGPSVEPVVSEQGLFCRECLPKCLFCESTDISPDFVVCSKCRSRSSSRGRSQSPRRSHSREKPHQSRNPLANREKPEKPREKQAEKPREKPAEKAEKPLEKPRPKSPEKRRGRSPPAKTRPRSRSRSPLRRDSRSYERSPSRSPSQEKPRRRSDGPRRKSPPARPESKRFVVIPDSPSPARSRSASPRKQSLPRVAPFYFEFRSKEVALELFDVLESFRIMDRDVLLKPEDAPKLGPSLAFLLAPGALQRLVSRVKRTSLTAFRTLLGLVVQWSLQNRSVRLDRETLLSIHKSLEELLLEDF